MKKNVFIAPESCDELFRILSEETDKQLNILAGGTDLVPKINLENQEAASDRLSGRKIVWIGRLGLNQIKDFGTKVSIGALCTLNEVMNNEIVKMKLPELTETIHMMAGMSIRNTGTIGGNVMNASPASDTVPMLIALDADFILKSAGGERTVKADGFFTGPGRTVAKKGEILTEIIIHVRPGKANFQKLGRRQAETLSVVNAAAYIEMNNGKCVDARLVLGSVGPTAVRCHIVEKDIIGKTLTREVVSEICKEVVDEINPIDDIRSSAWYRRKTAPVMAARAICAAACLN